MLPNLRRRYAQDPLGLHNPSIGRLAFGFLLAPFVPTPLLIVVPFFDDSTGLGSSFQTLPGLLTIMLLAGIVGISVTLVAGGPLYYVYRFMKWTSWWRYCLGGTLIADLCVFVLSSREPTPFLSPVSENLGAFGLFAVYGGVAALAFWAITRPDRLGT